MLRSQTNETKKWLLQEKIYTNTYDIYFRYLNMSFNLLQDLPYSGFLKMKTLETLDLSFNDLREIDDKTFKDMHWLSDLKVIHNISMR